MRRLIKEETDLFKSLWRWKLLTYPLAKKIAFEAICYGHFYSKIRRLLREGYIIERHDTDLKCTVLQLAKKGFEVLRYDLGELRENRFAAQSVAHDYWATAFQIGEFIQAPSSDVRFFTEQEIQCTDDSLLPEWVPKSRTHIPDGLTRLKCGGQKSVVAIEVELNLKPPLRYDKAGYYFDAGLSKIDVVLWLCGHRWIARKIESRLSGLKLRNREIHQFALTSEYRSLGWDCKIVSGNLSGKTLREIYIVKGHKTPLEQSSNNALTLMQKIFFPKGQSPQFSGK